MPALIAWMSSPKPGTNTTKVVSAFLTISTSDCPTPTVSMITRSMPNASINLTTSAVFLDNPPRLPRVPILRIKTFSFNVKSFIRIRSPKMAPPENGLVGSTATMPILLPCSK